VPHRIIYCALSCVSLLAHVPHNLLRNFDGGSVISVSDEVVGTLLKDRNASLLYLSLSDYQQTVSGLSDSDTEIALRRRLKQWSPRALDNSVDWILQDERRCLTLTAQAARGASGGTVGLLETHFNRGLDLMASILRPGGYDDVKLPDLLSSAVEKDAMLIAELGQTSEGETRIRFAKALAEQLRSHYNEPEFAQALPYAQPSRGVWVVPADKGLRAYLDARSQAAIEWRDGLVASLPLRAIEDFKHEGKKVEILYYDPGQLLQEIADIGADQMSRRFESLYSADEATRARQKADYLNELRLDLAVLRRVLRVRSAQENARLIAVLDPQIQLETQLLAGGIAGAGSWLSSDDRRPAIEGLLTAEDELRLDAAFFSSFAEVRGDAFVADRMHEILLQKKADASVIQDLRNAKN
jgi:hypothetical protein